MTQKNHDSYVKGLRDAERSGAAMARAGINRDACPYSRADFRQCWFEGWERGFKERSAFESTANT